MENRKGKTENGRLNSCVPLKPHKLLVCPTEYLINIFKPTVEPPNSAKVFGVQAS